MKEKRQDPLGTLRTQIEKFIMESYSTVEQFCWDKDVPKSTVSNFLNADRDPRFSTIEKLAEAFGKKVVIRKSLFSKRILIIRPKALGSSRHFALLLGSMKIV